MAYATIFPIPVGCTSVRCKIRPPRHNPRAALLDRRQQRLHADDNPSVRDLLNKYHIHSFSIFLHQIDGKWFEFGYYEYTGDDFEADMAKLAAEPRNRAWLKVCDPMQIPLKGEKTWATMERVFYNP